VARFDLYNGRKSWWWYYYLSLAAAKGTAAHPVLKALLFEAVDYEDNYDKSKREGLLIKYNGTNDTFKKGI
jgi:hypothetical protein